MQIDLATVQTIEERSEGAAWNLRVDGKLDLRLCRERIQRRSFGKDSHCGTGRHLWE